MRASVLSAVIVVSFFLAAAQLQGAETVATSKFLGATSCSSSGCHGGGGQNQNQFIVWSLRDFHSQRPFATLTTARSKQIADALQIKDPTADAHCTTCHAPLNQVPEDRRGENFKISEGVSCESCHGPAENWLRSHTRKDYTREDRVAAGMLDLKNLYVRANTCVACHQNVDSDILKAGHPELIFELDGQSVTMPKHWHESTNWNGAQTWLVGQFVALREIEWQQQMVTNQSSVENLKGQYAALNWLLRKVYAVVIPSTNQISDTHYIVLKNWGDESSRSVATMEWSPTLTRKCLSALAGSDQVFNGSNDPVRAICAERLVLALDRLVTALPELNKIEQVQSALNQLFKLAQSIPDFDSMKFASALADFSRAVAESDPAGIPSKHVTK